MDIHLLLIPDWKKNWSQSRILLFLLGTPAELKSTEELFLGAQHLEQYRHATYEPADYYEEGLRRDPSDIRLNNGYGMLLMKRGDFAAAKKHFEAAIEKQTWKKSKSI